MEQTNNITIISTGEKCLLEPLKDKYNVVEYDWINDDQLIVQLYQACDIFLMPSRQEAFGLMAIEAMSCGKMVLAIEGEGTALPEVINSPECGLAVKETEYFTELVRLLNNKDEVIDRGNKCLEFAKLAYSKERYINEIIRIYGEVIDGHECIKDYQIVLEQLEKYSNDEFIYKEAIVIKKIKKWKKAIRFCAKKVWKLMYILHLANFIKASFLYKLLLKNKVINKLRG